MTSTAANVPAYPVSRPDSGTDERFTIGLVLDVADVLARHGYPRPTCGADLVRLQQALFTTIYPPQESP